MVSRIFRRFFDGDGSIYIDKQTGGYILNISFTQCDPKILCKIQNYYGGKIRLDNRQRTENCRKTYNYRITGLKSMKILLDLSRGSIIKYKQIETGIELLRYYNQLGYKDIKEELCQKMKQYNKDYKTKKYNDEKPYDKLSIKYITGLFDAEGNIYVHKRREKYIGQRIKITQKNDSTLLLKIKEFLDLGRSDNILWKCENVKVYKYIIDFLKYSVVKKKQLKKYCFL